MIAVLQMGVIAITPHYRHILYVRLTMQGRLAPFRAKVRTERGRQSIKGVIGWVEYYGGHRHQITI